MNFLKSGSRRSQVLGRTRATHQASHKVLALRAFLFPIPGTQTWPGRSSQIPGNGGGSKLSTVPLPSWGSSSPLTLQTKNWAKMKRFAWQWGTSTSWSRSWGSKACSKREWLLQETFWDSSPQGPTCQTGLSSVTTRFLPLAQATTFLSVAPILLTQGSTCSDVAGYQPPFACCGVNLMNNLWGMSLSFIRRWLGDSCREPKGGHEECGFGVHHPLGFSQSRLSLFYISRTSIRCCLKKKTW